MHLPGNLTFYRHSLDLFIYFMNIAQVSYSQPGVHVPQLVLKNVPGNSGDSNSGNSNS